MKNSGGCPYRSLWLIPTVLAILACGCTQGPTGSDGGSRGRPTEPTGAPVDPQSIENCLRGHLAGDLSLSSQTIRRAARASLLCNAKDQDIENLIQKL
jgi:hypothetical protein